MLYLLFCRAILPESRFTLFWTRSKEIAANSNR